MQTRSSDRELKISIQQLWRKFRELKGLNVPTIAAALRWAVVLLSPRHHLFSVSYYRDNGEHVEKIVFGRDKRGKYRIVAVTFSLAELDEIPSDLS